MKFPFSGKFLVLICSTLFLLGFGCKKEAGYKAKTYIKHPAVSNSGDIKLPYELWDKLEKVGAAEVLRAFGSGSSAEKPAESGEASGGHESAPSADGHASGGDKPGAKASEHSETPKRRLEDEKTIEFFGLRVLIAEKTPGVLGGVNYSLEYAKGGGELNLSELVKKTKGSFYLVIESDELTKETPYQVFFLSNSKFRNIGDMRFGSGCNKYYEITSYFKKQMQDNGFLVNSTDERHISALAGTYFIATRKDGHLRLSQLTIKDSEHRDLLCR